MVTYDTEPLVMVLSWSVASQNYFGQHVRRNVRPQVSRGKKMSVQNGILCLFFFRRMSLIILWCVFHAFAKLRKATISFVKSVYPSFSPCFCLPVCPRGPTWLRFCAYSLNVVFEVSFLNLFGKFKPHYNVTRILGTLYEDLCAGPMVARSKA
jgi:hypothetical protein